MSGKVSKVPWIFGAIALCLLICGMIATWFFVIAPFLRLKAVVDEIAGEPEFTGPAISIIFPGAGDEIRSQVPLPAGVTTGTQIQSDGIIHEIIVAGKGRDSTIWFGGRQVDFEGLRLALARLADGSRLETHPRRPSLQTVLITASQEVRWRDVHWVLQVCADHTVRINRIYFAARSTDGQKVAVPAFLPMDRGLEPSLFLEGPETPKVIVELQRRRAEQTTRVQLLDQVLGAGAAGYADLELKAGRLHEMEPKLPVLLHAWVWVPAGEVVMTLDLLRRVGYEEILFPDAPPRPMSREFAHPGGVVDPESEGK